MSAAWVYDDGGRKAAGFKGEAGDCGVRAAAIALQLPYRRVYRELDDMTKASPLRRAKYARNLGRGSPNYGVWKQVFHAFMERHGWRWVPLMGIGTGCRVHLSASELPRGRIVCSCSRHYVAVVDGVARDTYDPTRGGTRCVYGYWTKEQ